MDGFHIFLTVVLTGVWLAGWQLEADGVKAVAYYGISIVAVLHIFWSFMRRQTVCLYGRSGVSAGFF